MYKAVHNNRKLDIQLHDNEIDAIKINATIIDPYSNIHIEISDNSIFSPYYSVNSQPLANMGTDMSSAIISSHTTYTIQKRHS